MTRRSAQKEVAEVTNEDWRLAALREMYRIRAFEEKSAELYRQGLLGGSLHLSIGQEAVAVGAISALLPPDQITMTYRGRGQALAKGVSPGPMFAEMLGRITGTSRGKGGPMHIYLPEVGVMGTNAIVAAGIPIAAGLALAAQLDGSQRVVMTFFGDGAVNQGAFHEAMNLAAIWKLPLVLVCENNLYSEMTPIRDMVPYDDVADRAKGYAIPAAVVDGNDVVAVRQAADEAVDRARQGRGPTFLECKTYRLVGHMVGDPEVYRTKEEVARWAANGPIVRLRAALLQDGLLSEEQAAAMEAGAAEEIAEAATQALGEPEPSWAEALTDV